MKKIRYVFMWCWVILFISITILARKNKKKNRIVEVIQECYYGYDPFVYRGILTGTIYAFLDGFIGGYLIEWYLKKRKK